jgi:hypothetical protein
LALRIGLGVWNHGGNTDRASKATSETIATKNRSTRLLRASRIFHRTPHVRDKNPLREQNKKMRKLRALEPVTSEQDRTSRTQNGYGAAADEKQDTTRGDCRTRARLSASHEKGANPEGKIGPAAKKLKSWRKTRCWDGSLATGNEIQQ